MKETGYRNFNLENSFSDANSALRYLRGKDQRLIREDDPEFFSLQGDRNDNISVLSSSRRILRKIPRNKRKEAH